MKNIKVPGTGCANCKRTRALQVFRGVVLLLAAAIAAPVSAGSTPRLVDLGAGKCIPCKKMAPILEELKQDYAGRMEVTFIDVWQDHDAAIPYDIRVIPTQIFYGADGKELYRHEGFYSRKQILRKWRELGYDFNGGTSE